ncbi:MAG: hypothetical protein Q8P17_04255 [bacterium]|nr:hypothetical protein [bacterium]
MNQIGLHKKIDDIIQAGAGTTSVKDVRGIVSANHDARRYFYARADETWLDWLWENGFLDAIREKAADTTRYSYQTPELDYLSRVVEKIPLKVTDFMLDVTISKDTFNPEVIDRFLWISSKLPADQLARIAPKIRDDRWVPLMGPFNRWGFEYKQMFDTLAAAKDHESIITLAEAMLILRSDEDVKRTSFGSIDNPFYFNDLNHSEVFERLSEVDEAHTERALELVLKTLAAIVILSGRKEDDVFEYGDMYSLFDVDFFTLTVGHERHLSSRDDVRDLAAVAKIFTDKLIGKSCGKPEEVRHLYDSYIVPLPDARTMWRFRLYIWSLCPDIFKEELRAAFFKGVESEKTLWSVTGGAEYEQALKKAFHVLLEEDRKKYIQRAFEVISTEKQHPYGFGIFSSISKYLSEEDTKQAEMLFKHPLNAEYTPEPSIGISHAGTVIPQAPPDAESEWKKAVPEIVELLKTKWTPETLYKEHKKQDFLRPINAEGIAGELLTSIKNRLQEYVTHATLFFDRDNLDAHYTYTFLRGIQESIKSDYTNAATFDWAPLVTLGKNIAESGRTKPFDHAHREREQFDAWLAGWAGVHTSLADVMQELFHDHESKPIVDFIKHRNDLFFVMAYLLTFPNPEPSDEKGSEDVIQEQSLGGGEYQASDPFTIAINTARGRAFQAFLQFVYQDGKKFSKPDFPKESGSRISEDVRKAYEDMLARENTRAIMFMLGHYLAFFYYRDTVWVEKLLPTIFTKEPEKVDLYMAAWEGYITTCLYPEMFEKLHDEYARAITLDPASYTKRKYRGNLDETLATHLALAYLHFSDFDFGSDLYKSFWSIPNTKRHGEFISFIGRHVISRDSPEEWLEDHGEVSVEKLEAFWDWALEHCDDKEALQGFGFWMQAKYKIFDPVWLADRIDKTLEKTNGDIGWEIGFVDSLPTLAKTAPEKTLSALRRHLIDGSILKEARGYIRVDSNLLDVLRTLYANASTREGTYKLINDLLPIGGGQFWGLKEILKD